MYKKESIMPLMISHRMRGFDETEASLIGLNNALRSPFNGVEFDTRLTCDQQLVVNHDPDLHTFCGERLILHKHTLVQVQSRTNPATGKPVSTLRELLLCAANSKRTDFFICLDIKELGQDELLLNLIMEFELSKSVVFFSWLPQALLSIHAKLPSAPLYFSYYPIANKALLLAMRVKVLFTAISGAIFPRPYQYSYLKACFQAPEVPLYSNPNDSVGFETEYYSTRLPEGELREVLRRSNGGVCVDYRFINASFSALCQQTGFKLCIYGVKDNLILKKIGILNPDVILTDDPDLTKF